jgi:ankyrin repeat protein
MNQDLLGYKLKELVQMGAYDKLVGMIRMAESEVKLDSIADKDGCTLLHWSAINNRVRIAQRILLPANCNVNLSGGILQEIPLQWAVRNDKFSTMVHMLLRRGSNVNFRNLYGHTALHIAAAHGNIHNAFLLLCNGADVNIVDHNGNSPLMYIIKDKPVDMTVETHRQVVQLLLSFGADVLLVDKNGNTPLHIQAGLAEAAFDPYIALQLIQYGGYSARKTVSNTLEARNISGLTPYMVSFVSFYLLSSSLLLYYTYFNTPLHVGG